MRGGNECSMGGCVFQGDGSSRGDGCSRGMGVPLGWVFQGGECSRGMSVLGDGCLGGFDLTNNRDGKTSLLAFVISVIIILRIEYS